jgi:GNAT acetyltransferase-like protein
MCLHPPAQASTICLAPRRENRPCTRGERQRAHSRGTAGVPAAPARQPLVRAWGCGCARPGSRPKSPQGDRTRAPVARHPAAVRMRLADRIVASFHGFTHPEAGKKRGYYYLGGFDPAFAQLSVGMLMIDHAVRDAIRDGAVKFDFLRGREAYKYRWGRRTVPLTGGGSGIHLAEILPLHP